MATIVRHKQTNVAYILLGTGYGAYKSAHTAGLLGNVRPTEDAGEVQMVALCDENGRIVWAASDDLYVVEVDGHAPSEVLSNLAVGTSTSEHAVITEKSPVSDHEVERYLNVDDPPT